MYKAGRDGGIDAQASNIRMLTNEKVIVQVKHTSNESETLKDGTRKNVFEKEIPKVEKMVAEYGMETYVIVTNYQLPGGQAQNYLRNASEKMQVQKTLRFLDMKHCVIC